VGKTDVSLGIAESLGLEVISCDSRQVYRGMDVGTAKPSAGDRARAQHWLLDVVSPDQPYSAYQWATDAERIIRERASQGRKTMIVGGTGFYYDCLCRGLSLEIPFDPTVRDEYEQRLRDRGADSIFLELAGIDPVTSERLGGRNVRRAVRAIEIYRTTGKRVSELSRSTQPPPSMEFGVFILTMFRQALYGRINDRVDAMIGHGLWNEFQTLVSRGYGADAPGMRCLGYQELFGVQLGSCTLSDAVAQIKRNSRHYAKRQLTWFRHQCAGTSCDLSTCAPADVTAHIAGFLR
jgi:tRNA dimethylallyltransferase